MGVGRSRTLVSLGLMLAVAGAAGAFVYENDSPLAPRAFVAAELDSTPRADSVADLPLSLANVARAELDALGVGSAPAFLDRRGGRWRTLLLSHPLLPGNGVGNALTWDGLGVGAPADTAAWEEIAWSRVREFIAANKDSLRINVDELSHRIAVHDDGELIQISMPSSYVAGIPVRGAKVTAVINSGNLVLFGAESWGDIAVGLTPSLPAESALATVTSFVSPFSIDSLRQTSELVLLPGSGKGAGYAHRLAWAVHPSIPGDLAQWEALVDAHTGEMLAFQDLNHYGVDRKIVGGVYPVSYDGIPPDGSMVQNYPMPYADLSTGGFTNSGGHFDAAGSVTTTLNGEFVRIQEFCGAISETDTGDIDLGGTDGDTDCQNAGSAGNTAAARSGFYEVNRIKEMARAQLPANTWLQNKLTAQMNISQTCNAFWTGSVIQFFRETGICGNTGQLAGVFDHEWGHGMDDFDVNGSIPGSSQGGGEGMADIYAALRLNQACVGRGFFQNGQLCGGYGDPCTAASGCTGIRSVDFADRTSGVPHDLTWVRANCGTTVHCLGAAYSETVWDLIKRDLPTFYSMDDNTALEVTTRLTFIGAGNASGWFDRTGPAPGAAACGATQAYLQYLAADDDNGNVADGTPHMEAIASAFDRHEIGCTAGNGGPTVQDSGCAGVPTTAPTLMATDLVQGADLSWTTSEGSVEYNVYRTDGEHQCDFGKTLITTTSGTTYTDMELMEGREYSYIVIPMVDSEPSCFGPASDCVSLGGTPQGPDIFEDDFESGDTSEWSETID